jgi:transitional endoplasmic reticulum ATPase
MSLLLTSQSVGIDADYHNLVELWILRALLRRNGVADFVRVHGFSDAPLARLLGFAGRDPDAYTPAWALASLEDKLARLEAAPPAIPTGSTLATNIARLAERLGLDSVEQDILHFTVLVRLHGEFSDALGTVGALSHATLCRLYAQCLGHPLATVQAALDDRAKLCRSALLNVDRSASFPFCHKVDLLDGFAEELMLEHYDLLDLFGRCLVSAPVPRLTLADFAHLDEDIQILTAYLDAGTRLQQPGVNVLIHGRPGTGKTEFARALGAAIGVHILEIPSAEPGGKPRAGRQRFDAFRLAQGLLERAHERHLLIFDEVEDVFCEASGTRFAADGNSSGIKGWVNQLLERNPVSTIWITNHLGTIDPAYLRRFDYVLHMDVPPASVRRRLVEHYTEGLQLTADWCAEASRHADLVPGIMQRAAKVGMLVCDVVPELAPERVMSRVMNNTFEALGCDRLAVGDGARSLDYRPDLLNADCDLARLLQGVRAQGEGRLCLYGPPGTGKSAYGRYLAKQLDRPLLVRRASDILSPYVGVAEQQIARMFQEARGEGAVLLLDEADSLLQDRRGAHRSWEVTQVNEMLTQMEAFDGIFIASTNMLDALDAAASRRFDASVRFDYLRPAQAIELFFELLRCLELPDEGNWRGSLAGIATLTPGDFAATLRGSRLDRPVDATGLTSRLTKMCRLKLGVPRAPMGFSPGVQA